MKKAEKVRIGELRTEYQRSDFGTLVRGKFVKRLAANSNVVVLDPAVTDLFPNAAAVNTALRSLARIAKRAASSPRRSGRASRQRGVAAVKSARRPDRT